MSGISKDRIQLSKRQLGRNGPMVSQLAFGTMTFGMETSADEAFRQLDCFVSYGGTFIDTADVYSDGVSEEIIGRWIKQRGGIGDIILSTKGRFLPPPGSHGGARRSIVKSIEGSLTRLKVEAIDVYYMHGWDIHTQIEETVSTLGDMIRMGKIHNIAWSNVSGWQIERVIAAADMMNVPRPIAIQPLYNLLDRWIELEVLPCCLENQMAIVPWSPLGGGWLTGKYSGKAIPMGNTRLGENPSRGVEAYDKRNIERTYRILDTVKTIAQSIDRPLSHIALAWLLSRPGVATLLVGARTVDQLEDNLASVNLVLEPEHIDMLNEVSAPGLPEYPYQFLADWSDMSVWKILGT